MRILLIDGNNIMFAAQHAKFKLTAGTQDVTAVFGMLGTLRHLMERWPDSVPIVLWDGSPPWRVNIYPEYKANRDENMALVTLKEALLNQRPITKDILSVMGVRQYRIFGQEADDLAGDLSKKFAKAGHNVVLVTRDGDWQQLVDDKVIWYDQKNDKVIDVKNFHAETGYLDQERFVEGKALHGDAGDNITGVGGIGEKGAQLILSEFRDYTDLVMNWDSFKATLTKGSKWNRYIKAIDAVIGRGLASMEKYELNLKLMNLRDTLIPQVLYHNPSRYDETAFKEQLGKYGFHSILRRYSQWMAPFEKGLVK